MSGLFTYLRAEGGASAAEYALILAIVGAAISVSMLFLGGAIGQLVHKEANCMAAPGSCTL